MDIDPDMDNNSPVSSVFSGISIRVEIPDDSDAEDNIESPPASPVARVGPIHLAAKLLVKDGLFAYVWTIGQGNFDTPAQRRRQWPRIMGVDLEKMRNKLDRYKPSMEFELSDANSMDQLLVVGVLLNGVLKLSIWKLERGIRDTRDFIKIWRKRRRNPLLLEVGQQEAGGVDPDDGIDPQLFPRPRRRRRTTKKRPAAREPTPERDPIRDPTPVEEDQPRRRRRPRRHAPEPVPTDVEIMRMLSTRLNHLQTMGDQNLLIEPTLPNEPTVISDHLDEDVPEEQRDEVNRSFRESVLGADVEPAAEPSTTSALVEERDAERILARERSVRSPTASARPVVPPNMGPANVEPEEDSFPKLLDVTKVPVRRRSGRRTRGSRMLVFDDVRTEMSKQELQINIRRSERTDANQERRDSLRMQLRDTVVKLKLQHRPGLFLFHDFGRRIIGRTLGSFVAGIRDRFPLPDREPGTPAREVIRAGSSVSAALGTGTTAGLMPTIGAQMTTGAEIEIDLHDTAVPKSPGISVATGTAEATVVGGVDISLLQSPRARSSPRNRAGAGPDLNFEMNFDLDPPPPPRRVPTVREQRELVFTDLVPLGSPRPLALRVFQSLLKHKAHGNVDLIQDESFGPIKIIMLNPNIDPDQYVGEDLIDYN